MPESAPPVNPFKKTIAASKRASTFGIAAIILAILAGVLAWIAWTEAHRVTMAIKTYADQMSQQTQIFTKTEQISVSKLQNQYTKLQKKFGDIEDKVDQLSNISVKAHNQRALSQVSSLIHMANLQLAINQNADSALQLMKLTHEQLKVITSPGVTKLKRSVAKDVAALEKAPKLDVAKLLAQLDQLKTSVMKLPGLPIQPITTSKTDDTSKTTKLPWYKKLGHSFSGLKQLVIIRHEKTQIKPLLSPQQLIFLKQNVQLKISEAEWAILYQNKTVYQQSLESAKQMLETRYPNQEALTDTLKQFTAVSKININPKLPDLSNTLTILNNTRLRNK